MFDDVVIIKKTKLKNKKKIYIYKKAKFVFRTRVTLVAEMNGIKKFCYPTEFNLC